ncbi:putative transcription factor bHLH041 [Curcuma longa]|uniref:putative transcription factor bHLH041 n=1 Tax=Curcuma longa TaxID=136217 RepID=UPI003D9DEC43
MNSFFLLGAEARRRFLPIAGRFLGCTYICTWSPLRHPAPVHLVSADGWHHEEDSGQSSSSGTSISSRLFDAYRRSLCSIHSGSIPGVAFKDGLAYVQLTDVDILNLASNHSQRQFYQEAEIKTAVFMGCRHGEIELGFRTPPNPKVNLQRNIQQIFSEEFIQQSLGSDLEIMTSEPGQLSSSSSSLRSLSLGSPDTSPRLLAQQSPPFIMQSFDFVDPRTAEDEAMVRALLAVIISSPLILNQQHVGIQTGAFRPYYDDPFSPEEELKPNRHSQRMIKIGLHMLRRISMMKLQLAAAQVQEYQQPMSNQSQHVISERKRRQKFNEHFNALKMLLPLEPKIKKKDKATVLKNVTNYLNLLKAQIKELEERNSALEMQVQGPKEDRVDMSTGDSNERVEVQVNRAPEFTYSETQQIDLRVVVKEDCDMIDWSIRVLECLKEMRGMMLISMETRTVSSENNRFGIASFRLQVQASYWVESTFKEAVSSAVANVMARVSDQIQH